MKKLIIVVLMLIICGCAGLQVYETSDKFNPTVKTLHSTVMSFSQDIFGMKYIDIDFLCNQAGNDSVFYVEFGYRGPNWMFMDGATFLLDGKPQSYESSLQPIREIVDAETVTEHITILVPEQLFMDLATTKALSIRVSGSNWNVDRDISPEDLSNINIFYQTVLQQRSKTNMVAPSPAPAPATSTVHKDVTGKIKLGIKAMISLKDYPDTAKLLGLNKPTGAFVVKVEQDSIASKAGLVDGDVILKYNGKVINNKEDVQSAVAATISGSAIPITIWRGREMVITAQF